MKKSPFSHLRLLFVALLTLFALPATQLGTLLQAQSISDLNQHTIFIPMVSGNTSNAQSDQQQEPAPHTDNLVQAAALSDTGQWSGVISMPLVPVGAANLPNGKVLTWSAYDRYNFGGDKGRTYTAIFDPATNSATERLVTETGHDMFCSGTSNLADGRLLISGGSSAGKTSIYNYANNSWSAAQNLVTGRGYHAQTVLPSGNVFTIGGSWSGGVGNKGGEVWSEGTGWTRLPGLPVTPIIDGINDPQGVYRSDNHAWLWTAPNGKVFHAGPASNMHWLDTSGSGSYSAAGPRGDDASSIKGTTVMYDVGKILKAGGAQDYSSGGAANNRAYVIDINSDSASVRRVQNLAQSRTMHNSTVLPNGQVLVTGGLATGEVFTDNGARYTPELWDPATDQWRNMADMAEARTYHSVAILLPDGRVMTGGGGLCGSCSVNHPNVEIFSPPYLFNGDSPAARPVITSAPGSAGYGATINVTTNAGVTSFSLIRLSSVTHSVNNDQRRIPLTPTTVGTNSYNLSIPGNRAIAPPGYYMLFALNAAGTPSVSTTIKIGTAQPGGGPACANLPTDVDYHIIARHSGKGLSVADASTDDSANIIQAPVGDGANDNWRLSSTTGGYYHMIAQHSNKALNVAGGSQTPGGNIVQSPPSGGTSDDWCFQPTSGGYYNIVARHSNLAIDVFRDSTADGANIVQWTPTNGDNQEWQLAPVTTGGTGDRYVRFVADSEVNGNAWSSMAEFNVLDDNGNTISRTGWTITTDSEETSGENGRASNVIDGDTSTIWHTQWQGGSPTHPHEIVINMGTAHEVGGFTYLPRQAGPIYGTIADYRFYVSTDGVNWGAPVAQGTFANNRTLKTVTIAAPPGGGNTPPVITNPGAQSSTVGSSANLALSASDADGDTLTYSASGLPTGLSINGGTGVIAGTATAAGSFDVTVTVNDGNGSSDSESFIWNINTSSTGVQPGTYRLMNVNSNRCIDVLGVSVDNGTELIQWSCHNSNNQKWQVAVSGAGHRLVAVHSGKAIDVPRGSGASGTNLIQWTPNSGTNQQWTIRAAGGNYEIVSVSSGLCMDVAASSTSNRAKIQQVTCNGSASQQWQLEVQ